MTAANGKYEYIADEAGFARLCESWRRLPAVGLDTEFIRIRTFYPKTGLLQFTAESRCFLVDPLTIRDWTPCRELLASTPVILHAAGEDLGLLQHLLGTVPAELFDTQLAAAFLGEGFSLSYRELVRRFCDVELPKAETRSNWLKRPLSAEQMHYAAEDVRYLPALAQALRARLVQDGKIEWFREECRSLLDIATESENSENWWQAFRQVGGHETLNERGLRLLQRLCRWREKEARARDLPRNWLATDRDLFAIAAALENGTGVSEEAIRRAAGVNPKFASRFAASLARMLNEDRQTPQPRRSSPAVLTPRQREVLKRCREIARQEALRIGVSPELLVKKRQLQQIVHSHGTDGRITWPPEMHGWRQQTLAAALTACLPVL